MNDNNIDKIEIETLEEKECLDLIPSVSSVLEGDCKVGGSSNSMKDMIDKVLHAYHDINLTEDEIDDGEYSSYDVGNITNHRDSLQAFICKHRNKLEDYDKLNKRIEELENLETINEYAGEIKQELEFTADLIGGEYDGLMESMPHLKYLMEQSK